MRAAISYLTVALAAAGLTYFLCQPGRPPALAQAQVPPRASVHPREPAPDLSPEEQANHFVYQKANRSVVNITTRALRPDDFLLFLTPSRGSGSGSVLDRKGHVVTNYHVVEDARQVAVTLHDGSTYDARLVGTDPSNDLAVLRIAAPAEKLSPIAWGDSGRLVVGMRVYAIGNPFGMDRTLTTGIISSLGRSLRATNDRLIRDMIQTDAAINPGNSGGPLLNRRGEMIGITTAIVARSGQNSGVGLAVPANTARRVVEELIRHGRVIRPDCGIVSVYQTDEGLLIARMTPDGPAEKAGLRGPEVRVVRRGGLAYRVLDRSKADLIVAVDGKEVRTLDDLLSLVESKKPGDRVVFTVVREGREKAVAVVLEHPRDPVEED